MVWILGLMLAGIVLALPVAALIVAARALTVAKRKQGLPAGIEDRVSILENQVAALRRAMKTGAAPAAPPAPASKEEALTTAPPMPPAAATSVPGTEGSTVTAAPRAAPIAPVARPPPRAVAEPAPAPAAARASTMDLEHRIGARWATWVGVIALLFAVGFFLQWSIKNGIIGPRTQVGLGLMAGIGMLIGGLATERRAPRGALRRARAVRAHDPEGLPGRSLRAPDGLSDRVVLRPGTRAPGGFLRLPACPADAVMRARRVDDRNPGAHGSFLN